jgi:hypothetical protein
MGRWRPIKNKANDHGLDRDMQMRGESYSGIVGIPLQDQAIQESQGGIVDRALEHLGTSDTAIIHVRRRLMSAARALRERGTPAPGRDPESFHVRSASVVLSPGARGRWRARCRG